MSTLLIEVENNQLSSLKQYVRSIRGRFHIVTNSDTEDVLEDRWLSRMIDESENEKGQVSRKKMSAKFAKDGITL